MCFKGQSDKIGNDTEKISMAPAQGWHAQIKGQSEPAPTTSTGWKMDDD